MSKLETLKDLELDFYEIRKAAVQWIKRFCADYQINFSDIKDTFSPDEKQPFAFIFNSRKDLETKRDGLSIIAFIKHFFNITEEDLE